MNPLATSLALKIFAGWDSAESVLRVAGQVVDTGYHESLKREAHRLGISERVEWLGEVDVAAELATASILLHTAIREAQPMAVLEALAARVPVLVRREAVMGSLVPVEAVATFADVAAAVTALQAISQENKDETSCLTAWRGENVAKDLREDLNNLAGRGIAGPRKQIRAAR